MLSDVGVYVKDRQAYMYQTLSFKDKSVNDNAVRNRRTIVERIIKEIVSEDPYLKPLKDLDFPFGYLSPDQDYPKALFMVHTNMLCHKIKQAYGEKISRIVRAYLED